MDPDSDLFDDILPKPALTNARAGGKFQPRAKPRSTKVASVSVHSIPPSNAEKKVDAAAKSEPLDIVDDRLTSWLESSLASSATLQIKEPLESNDDNTKAVEEPTDPLTQVIASKDDNGLSELVSSSLGSSEMVGDKERWKNNEGSCSNKRGSLEAVNLSPARSKDVDLVGAMNSEVAISDGDGDQSAGLVKSAEEAGLLGFDSDILDDILPKPDTSNSKAGGKFKPKAKSRPRNGIPAPVSSSKFSEEEPMTLSQETQSAQPVSVKNTRAEPVGPLLPGQGSVEINKLSNDDEILYPDGNSCASVNIAATVEKSGFPSPNLVDASTFTECDMANVEPITCDEAIDGRSNLEESGVFPDLQTPGVFAETIITSEICPRNCEFNPMVQTSSPIPNIVESVMPLQNAQFVPSETVHIDDSSVAAFPSDNIGVSSPMHLGNFIPPAPCTSEFQMDQELQGLTETSQLNNVNVVHPEDVPDVPEKESSKIRKRKASSASNHSSKKADIYKVDKLSKRLSKLAAVPQLVDEPTEEEVHGNGSFLCDSTDQNRKDFAETSCSINEIVVRSEDDPVVVESSKSRKRKASSASNCSQKSKKSSVASDMNEGNKSTRQVRKRVALPKVIDELDEEAHDNGGLPTEPPSSSLDEEDNDYEPRADEESDDEYQVETASPKKGTSKKSKEPVAKKEKPVRKRKKSNDVPEKSNQVPPKKFSHSTRRNRRRVNKDLLNMPEDEIDFKRLPIRDIILLAEHKERLAIKEATASKPHLNNRSTDIPFHGENSDNQDDRFASDEDRSYSGEQTTFRAQPSTSLFNHQSFMDKTPKGRWSKQDTELFYEGIRQFGSDLSMIQQLFPGRERQTIKLKFKKEERQNPLRLHEALGSRPKDNSYFEKVIEQLQAIASQEEHESYRDDFVGVSGEEGAELNAETNGEVTKLKQDGDAGVEDQEANVAEDNVQLKHGDIDDDLDIWSSYTSGF